jgi:hypothetical protein
MSAESLQLDRDQWESVARPANPFWLPLLAMLLLSFSFMQFFAGEPSGTGEPSGGGAFKFAMHIAAYVIMGLVFIKYFKGKVPNSSDLKLYVTYCMLVLTSVFIYAFRIGDANTEMFARALDLTFFAIVILIVIKMKIEDSFFITFAAVSAPVFSIILIYIFIPEQAFNEFTAPSGETVTRLGGKNMHPNLLARCAAISFLLVWGLGIRKGFKIFLALVFFTVIIFSQSRTSLLTLIISVIGAYIIARGNLVTKLLGACSLVLFLIGAVLIYQTGVGDLIPSRPMFDNVGTLGGRTLLWEVAWREFSNASFIEFLFGMNPFFASKEFYVHSHWTTSSLHNTYFHVLVGCGIFTVAIYTLMLVRLLRINAATIELAFSFRAVVVYILVNGLTEQTAATKMGYFTIMLPLIMAQCHQRKGIENDKPEISHETSSNGHNKK